MEGYSQMAENGRTAKNVKLQLEVIKYTKEADEYRKNSGPYDNRASGDGGDGGDDYDNVYLSLPYRSGFVLRQRTQRAPHVPPVYANMTPQTRKKTSVLSDRNKKFMKSVKGRDITSIQEQLETNPDLATCSDDQGISALSEAARAGPKLLDAFLREIKERRRLAVWIEHALLYAIKADNYESVEFLIGKREDLIEQEIRSHPAPSPEKSNKKKKQSQNPHYMTWSNRHNDQSHLLAEFEDAEFPVYLTPVILAAKLHRVEILKLLLEKPYACEIHPLTAECPLNNTDGCEICREQRVFKSKRRVEESKRLVEIYKALSSPTYILNSGVKDPVLEAFQLSREMQGLTVEDAPFKAEYDAICKRCREFARDLLDLCRSTEEIETLLRVTEGIQEVNSCPESVEFQRIIVAVNYGQKEFLTHPSCQQVLQRKWYDGLPNWVCETERRTLAFLAYLFLWFVCWPFACVGFMLKLFPWLITFMKHPINKFISDTISFIWFLVFLVIECNTNTSHDKVEPHVFSPTEFLIIIWVLGMLARLVKMIWRHRHACCANVSIATATREWRWYEIFTLGSFLVWFVLHLIGYMVAFANDNLDKERREWKQYDLLLISEGFFSLGTVLSFIKLIGLFKASSSLGPLQISLRLMLKDILRFLFIFFITMTGFVMALTHIYSNYKGHIRIEGMEEPRTQDNGLVRMRNSYKTLFWALFGYGEPSVADVVVGNTGYLDDEESPEMNATLVAMTTSVAERETVKHKVTEVYGYVLFGSYHIVAIIVLINMLIAMMARSYEVIACNADLEWKYARTKLRMIYFSEVGSLPPPFNIAVLGQIMKCCISGCRKCCQCCHDRYPGELKPPKGDYDVLVSKLGKRYLSRQTRELEEKENEHEISRQDLARLASFLKKQQEKSSHA